LASITKLNKLSNDVKKLGYDSRDIHIVWVINDVEVAIKQNMNPDRGRVVPIEILMDTHRGASTTMHGILDMGKDLTKYMDGDIIFAFNKFTIDSEVSAKSPAGKSVLKSKEKSSGFVVDKANYFHVKRVGKPVISISNLDKELRYKLRNYVPKSLEW